MMSDYFLNILLTFLFGYVLGSIPFGVLFSNTFMETDIRKTGSGNIGATNVLRAGFKMLAAATLFCDIMKGTLAVTIVFWFFIPGHAVIAGLGAFIGHCFPVWIKFRGGKGVATFAGILTGIAWQAAVLFFTAWLLFFLISRYSSLSALLASVISTVSLYFFSNIQVFLVFVVLTLLLWGRHYENIQRIVSGKENKIDFK